MAQGERIALHRLPFPGSFAIRASLRDYAFPRHFHDEYHITVMLSGAQASTQHRGPDEIQHPGQIKLAEPGEVHDGIPVDRRNRNYWTLYFDRAAMAEIHRDIGVAVTEPGWGTRLFEDAVLLRDFAQLFDVLSGNAPAMAIETSLLAAIGRLAEKSCRSLARERRSASSAIAYARQMIDDDPGRHYRLAHLAEASGLTSYQVVHGFQRLVGLAPHAYQIQRRVSLAKQLIQSGLSLAEAAAESGFSDQAHMNRTFKAIIGVPPGAFKAFRTHVPTVHR